MWRCRPRHLTPAQRRAYVIADNKLALNAGWDQEQLKIELGELQLEGFDLSLTGFDDAELARGPRTSGTARADGPAPLTSRLSRRR